MKFPPLLSLARILLRTTRRRRPEVDSRADRVLSLSGRSRLQIGREGDNP